MNRQDLSRRSVQITVGGLDVTPAILTWSVGRDAIGFEAAATVTGSLVLSPQVGESLDPKSNPHWNPGKSVTIQIANDSDVLEPLPFGGQLRILSTTYSSGKAPLGGNPGPEQLVIELGDALAYAREPQKPSESEAIELGTATSISTVTDLYLQTKNLSLQAQAGDPTPSGTLNYAPTYSGRSASLVDWLHKRLWCQPDGNYGLWMDSSGRVRLFQVDTAPTSYWQTYNLIDLPSYVPVQDQREQVPGAINATCTITLAKSLPTSSRYTALAKDTEGTVIGWDRVNWNLSISQEKTTTQKYRRRGGALEGADTEDDTVILAERTSTTRNFDVKKRNDQTVTEVFLLEGNVDPDQEGSEQIILAQKDTVTNEFTYGVVVDRQSETRKAKGLLDLDGTATELDTEQIFYQNWDKIGNQWRYFSRIIYNADIQRANQYSGAVPSGGGPNSRPPGPEMRPDLFEITEEQLTKLVAVAYEGGETLTGAIDLYGQASLANGTYTFTGTGAFADSEALLNWDGTGMQPSGILWEGTGTYSGTGFFRGVGNWNGSGTWTGTQTPGRTLDLDYEDYPVSLAALESAAQLEATLILGRYHAHEVELPLSDVLGEWAPGQVIRVGSDIYLLSGEVINGQPNKVSALATALWLGTDDGGGGGLTPGLTIQGNTLSTQGGRLDITTQSGDAIAA